VVDCQATPSRAFEHACISAVHSNHVHTKSTYPSHSHPDTDRLASAGSSLRCLEHVPSRLRATWNHSASLIARPQQAYVITHGQLSVCARDAGPELNPKQFSRFHKYRGALFPCQRKWQAAGFLTSSRIQATGLCLSARMHRTVSQRWSERLAGFCPVSIDGSQSAASCVGLVRPLRGARRGLLAGH
jgi:hypothetical protein